jgi:hypothetical protein
MTEDGRQMKQPLIKSFCGGIMRMKGGRVEGEKVRNSKLRLKASKHSLHANYNVLYDFQQFCAFLDDSVQSKKPSRWPKALIGSPCHGALAAGGK